MESQKHFLIVELGGTWWRRAIAQGNKILVKDVIPTPHDTNVDWVLNDQLAWTKKMLSPFDLSMDNLLAAIFSIAGPLDKKRKIIRQTPNIWQDHDVRFARLARQILGMKSVLLVNDADAAALGENRFGAGTGVANMVYLTLSTGIGSGIIRRGVLRHGTEFGHIPISFSNASAVCGCGGIGHFESISSGTGIANAAKVAIALGQDSTFVRSLQAMSVNLNSPTAKDVCQLAILEDQIALRIIHNAADGIAAGIAAIYAMFPGTERVVLGGGLTGSWDKLLAKQVLAALPKYTMKGAPISPESIVKAVLEEPGILGALALANERF